MNKNKKALGLEKGGWRRVRGDKCEVMEREAVNGVVHVGSVLACGSGRARVFTHLSESVEEKRRRGSVKTGQTRGVCHTVWR